MADRYCSANFKCGEDLDRALMAALDCCENAERAGAAQTAAAQSATDAEAAKVAAEQARDEARGFVGGDFVPTSRKVNGKELSADITLNAGDVGAPTVSEMDAAIAAIPTPDVSGQIGEHNTNVNAHADIRQAVSAAQGTADEAKAVAAAAQSTADSKAEIGHTHDEYLTSYTETDPTVPAWAKATTKPTYTASEVGAAASSHTHSASDITKAGYLAIHPEFDGTTTIPYIYNDLAFLTLKGGSVSAYTTTSTDLTAENLEQGELNVSGVNNLFNGTPSVAYLMTDGNYVAVIDIVLHKMFQWSNNFYIDFGTPVFRAKNIAVYAMNKDTEATYTLKNSVTNNSASYYFCKIEHDSKNSSGTTVRGFNRLRIVLSDFYQSGSSYGRRIAEIGLVNYSSAGVTETLVSRGGCSGIYGDLIPQTDSNINLGSSAKKWNNIYGKTIYQNGKQVANKEDIPANFAVTGKVSASGDLNTVIKSGMYRLDGLPANSPDGVSYGQLLVVHGSGDTIAQIAFSYNGSNMWIRSGNPTDVGGSGTWQEWVRCYTTSYKPTPTDIGLSTENWTFTLEDGTTVTKAVYVG